MGDEVDGRNIDWLQPSHHGTYTLCLQANGMGGGGGVLEAAEQGAAEY